MFSFFAHMLASQHQKDLKPQTCNAFVRVVALVLCSSHYELIFIIPISAFLSSTGMCPGVLLAGLTHYWVAWLVATQRSFLAKHRKLLDSPKKAVRWGQSVHWCVCVCVCAHVYVYDLR